MVDDDPLVCAAIRVMLTSDGHTVETANSCEEALSLLELHKFDMVVADYAMPVMRGDQLAVAVKARLPGLPVIMITAYAETLGASGTPPAGTDFVLGKPFGLQDLRDAMTSVLGEKKPCVQ